jgi:hypothetical protein
MEFRPLTATELELLRTLLAQEFPGAAELRRQLQNLEIRPIDAAGNADFRPQEGERALVRRRVPVEAEYVDSDGATVHVLVHVADGRLSALEVYKESDAAIVGLPTAERLSEFFMPYVGFRSAKRD